MLFQVHFRRVQRLEQVDAAGFTQLAALRPDFPFQPRLYRNIFGHVTKVGRHSGAPGAGIGEVDLQQHGHEGILREAGCPASVVAGRQRAVGTTSSTRINPGCG